MNTYILYGDAIKNAADLHDQLAALMSFPGYYGHNMDALFDVLTDISEDVLLVVFDADQAALALEDYWDLFLRVLADAAEENEHFHWEKR